MPIFVSLTKHYACFVFQEYSEDSNSEPDVDLENQYYNSKALKEDDPKAALQSFQKVLDLEGGDKGEWGFKALKQMIKINFKLVGIKILKFDDIDFLIKAIYFGFNKCYSFQVFSFSSSLNILIFLLIQLYFYKYVFYFRITTKK